MSLNKIYYFYHRYREGEGEGADQGTPGRLVLEEEGEATEGRRVRLELGDAVEARLQHQREGGHVLAVGFYNFVGEKSRSHLLWFFLNDYFSKSKF